MKSTSKMTKTLQNRFSGLILRMLFGTSAVLFVLTANPAVAHSQLSFEPATILPFNVTSNLAAGDFNEDGYIDIAATYNALYSAWFAVFLGTGGGTFGSPTPYFPVDDFWGPWTGYNERPFVADLNNDGNLDFFMTSGGMSGDGDMVAVRLGDGAGEFLAPGIMFSSGISLTAHGAGDFDEDGNLDLVINGGDAEAIIIHFGDGDGGFDSGRWTYPGYSHNRGWVVRDLNGDGHLDLAGVFRDDNVGMVLLGDGNGDLSPLEPFSVPEPNGIAAGDFDEDGTIDLAVSSATQGTVYIFRGTGGGSYVAVGAFSVVPPTAPPTDRIHHGLEAADFDRDGHLDLAVAHEVYEGTNISVLLGDGDGAFGSPSRFFASNTNISFLDLRVADLNGDGRPDIMSPSSVPPGVSILLNSTVVQVANAGPDQIVFDEVILDGGQSDDPYGEIVLYQWELQHREDSVYDRTAEGVNLTISDLEAGFYDVTLTVTHGDGLTDTDTMLLAAVGPCAGLPEPNAGWNIRKLEIKEHKHGAKLKVDGYTDLPELGVSKGDLVDSRATLELFGVLPDGSDLVISSEETLEVKHKKHLEIKKQKEHKKH